MKLIILAAFVTVCCAGRLENTYLPPTGAAGAGGGPGLAAPFGGNGGHRGNGFGGGNGGNGNGHHGGNGNGHHGGNGNGHHGAGSSPGGSYPAAGASGPGGYDAAASGQRPFQAGGANGGFQGGNQGGYGGSNPDADATILHYDNENNGDGTYKYSFETSNGIKAQEEGELKDGGDEGIQSVKGSYSYTAPDGQVITVEYTADENGFVAQGDHLPTPPPIPEEILKSLEQNAAEEAAASGGNGYPSGGPSGSASNFGPGSRPGFNPQQGYNY